MAKYAQLSLQDSSSSTMFLLSSLHDYVMVLLSGIIIFVFLIMFFMLSNKYSTRNLLEAQMVETIWTVTPGLLLIGLAIPSLRLLYIMEEVSNPILTIKTIGHQWYWEYEYSDLSTPLSFSSYMKPETDLAVGDFRLLEVDNRAPLPYNSEIRMIVTAADVIHSWTVPALGVKVDAIPGRLNQLGLMSDKPGVLYGQCSEICGANHSFMPIVLEFLDWNSFKMWLESQS